MEKTIIIVAENKEKFTADQIAKAFECRYGKIVEDIDVNDTLITVAMPNTVYKMFKKLSGKNYESAILKIVCEDFSDDFTQIFEDGIWIE